MKQNNVLDNRKYEKELNEQGVTYIAGVDEVGRGPLIGPVVTACVILKEGYICDGLTDSKKLSSKKRDYYYDVIMKDAIAVGIGIVGPEKIDEVNIYEATKIAMYQAIDECSKIKKPEHILIDAMKLENLKIPSTSIIKGDLKSLSIAAASVIAKVTRDRMMMELDEKFPMYDFKNNMGYPTKKHIKAIEEYGILKEHRKTFKPVCEHLDHYQN